MMSVERNQPLLFWDSVWGRRSPLPLGPRGKYGSPFANNSHICIVWNSNFFGGGWEPFLHYLHTGCAPVYML